MAKKPCPTVVANFGVGDQFWTYEIIGDPYIRLEGPFTVKAVDFAGTVSEYGDSTYVLYHVCEQGGSVHQDKTFSTAEAALKKAKAELKKFEKVD